MKPKVYLETSVISYYTGKQSNDLVIAGRQQITREWWEESRWQFDLNISLLVLEEVKGGDPSAAKKRLEALSGIPVLRITDKSEVLAEELINSSIIPRKCAEDALHIAIAAINAMDFLLTWNFNHINNAVLKNGIIRSIESQGYECPVICSPEELMGELK